MTASALLVQNKAKNFEVKFSILGSKLSKKVENPARSPFFCSEIPIVRDAKSRLGSDTKPRKGGGLTYSAIWLSMKLLSDACAYLHSPSREHGKRFAAILGTIQCAFQVPALPLHFVVFFTFAVHYFRSRPGLRNGQLTVLLSRP